METLLKFLNSLPKDEQINFAERCDTSVGYLRKAVSAKQQLGGTLCINIERESKGAVRCEDLLPGADWAFIRNTQLETD